MDKRLLAAVVTLLLLGSAIAFASWQEVTLQQRIEQLKQQSAAQNQTVGQLQQQIQFLLFQIQNLTGQPTNLTGTIGNPSNLTEEEAYYQSLLSQYESLLTSFANSRSGLDLEIVLGSDTIKSGDAVFATATLTNALSANLTLPGFVGGFSTQINLGDWSNRDGYFCNPQPVAMAVFSGFYTTGNLSRGSPLYVGPPLVVPCPVITSPYYFVLLPRGSLAYEFFSVPPFSGGTLVKMNTTLRGSPLGSTGMNSPILNEAVGYWSGQQNSTAPFGTFQAFPAGVYTIAARDIWGDLAITYFTVLPSTTSSPGSAENLLVSAYEDATGDLNIAITNGGSSPSTITGILFNGTSPGLTAPWTFAFNWTGSPASLPAMLAPGASGTIILFKPDFTARGGITYPISVTTAEGNSFSASIAYFSIG